MAYMFLFFTHSGAIKFARSCAKSNIPCELLPVPRALSSNCSISAKIKFAGPVEELSTEGVEKIFLMQGADQQKLTYKLLYEAD